MAEMTPLESAKDRVFATAPGTGTREDWQIFERALDDYEEVVREDERNASSD